MDDLQLPGALHATFVRSYMAHAKITGIDKSAAEAAGARVFTAADTDLTAEPASFFIASPVACGVAVLSMSFAAAFGFLAARGLKGLPLSYPATTGVPMPMTGGLIARP